MGTPDEVNVCPPIYPVKHIFSMKKEGASEGFCYGKGKKKKKKTKKQRL
jgi:hypothetical protein